VNVGPAVFALRYQKKWRELAIAKRQQVMFGLDMAVDMMLIVRPMPR
jgi:hypothetical protein